MARRQLQTIPQESQGSQRQTRSKTLANAATGPLEGIRSSGSSATEVSADASPPKRRKSAYASESVRMSSGQAPPDEDAPLLGDAASSDSGVAPMPGDTSTRGWTLRTEWMVFALASGACAAFNGVFAKLTTTELTSNLSGHIAALLNASPAVEKALEVVLRGSFFGLNLLFNGIMWTLFTTALARGTSTTQVSILNTSSNFLLTAVLGFVIFSEGLPPLWWAGAALLIAGNVIAGRGKDEVADSGSSTADGITTATGLTAGVEGVAVAAEATAEEIAPLVGEDGVLGTQAEERFDETTPPVLPMDGPEKPAEGDDLDLDVEAVDEVER